MDDLTILYITASEMPNKWLRFQIKHLLKAIENTSIISVSRKPMNLGINLIDTEKKCYFNIYMQMLRAALLAKTLYVAMAEDDVLYSKEHFIQFRPKLTEVSYNRARWSLFSWDPIYCLRQRISNCSLIAPTKLLIEALSERKTAWPDGAPNEISGEVGRSLIDKQLHVIIRDKVEWYSTTPIIHLNHPDGNDAHARRKWKKHGQIKAYDIPYWGRAEEIARVYNEGNSQNN